MANKRGETYRPKVHRESFDELSSKLTEELKQHVRSLADFPVMSDAWMQMAEHVARIGDITEMERSIPKKDNATLWECEEIGLRYLLEYGKLNLCLRNLVAFEHYMKSSTCQDSPLKPEALEALENFEQGICLTLKNAWLHVEAVQTTDLPLLLEYIQNVLSYCNDFPDYINEKNMQNFNQEIAVIHFLSGLCKNIECVDESRIMPLIQEKQIFGLFAMHLSNNITRFPIDLIQTGVEVLAELCATEDFQSHPEYYIDSHEIKDILIALKEDYLDDIMTNVEIRKKIRPLLDAIKDMEG